MPNPKPVLALVDDEPEMRKALRRLLTGVGFAVVEFPDGKLLFAALASPLPDCVLLDLHMPEVSGFAVLEELQARCAHLPVIVITAHDEPGTERRVRSLGARAYLKKPVDRSALLAAIRAAIAHPTPPNTQSK